MISIIILGSEVTYLPISFSFNSDTGDKYAFRQFLRQNETYSIFSKKMGKQTYFLTIIFTKQRVPDSPSKHCK